MVNVISNQLTALITSSAPEKPKQSVTVDQPVAAEQRQIVAATKAVVTQIKSTVSTPVSNSSPPSGDAVTQEELKQAVQKIKLHFQNLSRDLQFSYDEHSGHQVITVLDSETGEVIRQIPSEEVRALAQYLGSGTGGLIKTEA